VKDSPGGLLGSFGELLPGHEGFEEAIAQGNYEFARTRFVRAATRDGVARIVERAAQMRGKLHAEIDGLRALVRVRHEAAVEAARAYGTILPHRVGKTWIQPPMQTEKIGQYYGSDRFYKQAARAAKDYVEIRDLLVKKRDQLMNMEQNLRDQLDRRGEALIAQMESPRGLEVALQRDPLLNSAYQKLKALQGELKSMKVEDGLTDL
jgi:hypothetical protein